MSLMKLYMNFNGPSKAQRDAWQKINTNDITEKYHGNLIEYDKEGNQHMSIVKHAAYPFHLKESHKGLLHKEMGIEEGQPIPLETMQARLASEKDPAIRRRLQFAINARKFHHKK